MKKSFLLLALLLLGFAADAAAQEWVQTGGPGGGLYFQTFFNAKNDIFISRGPYSELPIMRSTDNGKSWSNITPLMSQQTNWWSVVIAPNQEIFLRGNYNDTNNSSRSGIWRSSDNGSSWIRLDFLNADLTFIGTDNTVYISSADTNYFYHFLRSKNSLKDWDTLSLPLPKPMNSSVSGLVDSNGVLFLNVDSGSLVSRDRGNSWQRIAYTISDCGKKRNVFGTTSAGRFHSSDDGTTWNQIIFPGSGRIVTSPSGLLYFYKSKQYVYPRSDTLLYSSDYGITWNDIALPSVKRWDGYYSFSIFSDADSGIYYYQHNDGEMFHAAYPGAPWTTVVFPTGSEYDIAAFKNGSLAVLAPTYGADTYIDPTLWNSDSLQSNWQFNNIFSGKFYKDSSDNVFLKESDSVYTSQDAGKSWKSVWKNLSDLVYGVVFFKDAIVVELRNSLVISYDGGVTWVMQNRALGVYDLLDLMGSHDGLMYCTGLYRSGDQGQTFQKFTVPFDPNRISLMISNLYGEVFVTSYNPFNLYRSRDRGETWSLFTQGLNCTTINSLIELPDGSISAATDNGVFILPLGGCQWYAYSKGLWSKNVPCIAVSTTGVLYAGSDGYGIFKSTKTFPSISHVGGNVDPGTIDFGSVFTDSTLCKEISIKNIGFAPFTINSYIVADPIPFSVLNVSVHLPAVINPKDSITATICFHPHQAAVYSSSVIWNTDLDPALCGINRETALHGIDVAQSSVKSTMPVSLFSLHPNPTSSNSVTLDFSEALSQPVALSVYDLLGREVYRNTIASGLKEFDLPIRDLAEGIYYARIELNGKTVTEQFIKVK